MKFRLLGTLGLLIVGTAAASAPAAYQDTVLADDPIVYYRLGESSGATNAANLGSMGSAVDGIYAGVRLGAPGLIAPSASGGDTAVEFPSNTSSSVRVPDATGINAGGPHPYRSIELWFNASTLPQTGAFAMLFEEGGEFNGFNVYLEDDDIVVGAWAGGNRYWIRQADAIAAGDTYHVIASFGDNAFTGYLNGVSMGSLATVTSVPTHTGDMYIGSVNSGGSSGTLVQNAGGTTQVLGPGSVFNGTIDEFAMYNSALSAGQAQTHYIVGTGGNPIPEPAAFAGLLAGAALLRRR